MFAEAIRVALEDTDDISVVGAAEGSDDGWQAALASRPDVVLMDYRLPDGDGVALAQRVKTALPGCKVVMLTGVPDDAVLRRAVEAGCSGYVTKNESIADVIVAVRAAHRGETAISPERLARIIQSQRDRTELGHDLTPRELEVLQLLADGLSNVAIAERLGIQLVTARNHVQSLLAKLEAHSKLEAVSIALRRGLVSYPG